MNETDAARFLGVPEATLQRWTRQGLLGGATPIALEYDPERLRTWAESRGIRPVTDRATAPTPEENLLSAAVARGAVGVGEGLPHARAAIERAVAALEMLPAEAREEIRKGALARELMAATGIGRGIALPHPRRTPGAWVKEPLVSVLYLDPALDWTALDGEAVHTLFLVLAPDPPRHLQLLSRLAYSLRTPGFREELRARPAQSVLVDRLRLIKRVR